ncbi:MAG TPA: hypothetical protein VG900_16395 [Hyphomicrobiaceae bacterium]|nr:hypothetical protein [Hyphomicrobiaceae bacterium]
MRKFFLAGAAMFAASALLVTATAQSMSVPRTEQPAAGALQIAKKKKKRAKRGWGGPDCKHMPTSARKCGNGPLGPGIQ